MQELANITYKEFNEVLQTLSNELGREALDNMHIHISGVSSNSKGDLKTFKP